MTPMIYAVNFIEVKISEEMLSLVQILLDSCDLDDGELKSRFQRLICTFSEVWNSADFIINDKLKVHIEINGDPKRLNAYPISDKLLAELHRQVNDLVQRGIIIKVENVEWVSPVVMLRKSNGKWRLTLEYR